MLASRSMFQHSGPAEKIVSALVFSKTRIMAFLVQRAVYEQGLLKPWRSMLCQQRPICYRYYTAVQSTRDLGRFFMAKVKGVPYKTDHACDIINEVLLIFLCVWCVVCACGCVCFDQINVGVPVRALVREADDLLWLTSLYHDERAMVGVQVSYKPLGARCVGPNKASKHLLKVLTCRCA